MNLSRSRLKTPGVDPGVKASPAGEVFCYAARMDIRLSAHEAYHHRCHIVWIPRKRVLKRDLKDSLG